MTLSLTVSARDFDLVKNLGIMTGYDSGSFGEEDILTRAQFSKVAVMLINNDFTPYGSVSPYSDVPYTHWAASYISYASDMGILSGYPDGTFMPEKEVTYEEACKVLLYILKYDTNEGGDWSGIQINTAKKVGILAGVEYAQGEGVTRSNAAKMVQNSLLIKPSDNPSYYIETLGYKVFRDAVIITDETTVENKVLTSFGTFGKNGVINENDILKCGDLITDEYSDIISFIPKEQTRKSFVVKAVLPKGIVSFENEEQIELADDLKTFVGERQTDYQSIKGDIKSGDKITLYSSGNKTEYISIEKNVIKGPFTNAGSSIAKTLGLDSRTKVIRDGISSDISMLQEFDICYFIKESNILLAYSKKQTGIFENALPNKDNPTSIVLSGTSYEIGGIDAFNKLSSNGSIKFGDTVTVLFDKDGKIADVLTPDNKQTQTAYLIDTGLKEWLNEQNDKSYLHYARLVAVDGNEQEVITDKDYSAFEGMVVSVSFTSGKAKLTVIKLSDKVSGIFNWSNKTLGEYKLSDELKILDVAGYQDNRIGKYVKVFPQRINKVRINSRDILYLEKNPEGEISSLVLNNVTNDMYSFGLVAKAQNQSAGMYISGEYDLLVGGEKSKAFTTNKTFSVYSGQPALFDFEGNDLKRITSLIAVEENIKSIDEYYLYTNTNQYKLSDKLIIYKKTSYTKDGYEAISLSELISKNYKFKAYYDAPYTSGGQIRVLLVSELTN